ncbi:MAG: hypothetical protein LBM19_02545 [Holosporales bacterium]|jgi:uncharacterized phage-associated protein|nr:hypothetical protein [Holosporales bacterium]
MLNPIFLANNFIEISFNTKEPITPMKLQKMMYFLYRDYLREENIPLFAERFLTWDYCPVLGSLYRPLNGIDLSKLTHNENCAWYKAYQSGKEFLSDEDIKKDNVEIK